MTRHDQKPDPQRRNTLKVLTAAAGSVAAAGVYGLAGCSGGAESARNETLSIPLSDLPLGERVTVSLRGMPVEIVRTDDGVRATSLVCTHFGCVVRWVDEDGLYRCPCHEGTFDVAGNVAGGPPTAPLKTIPAAVSGATLTLGT